MPTILGPQGEALSHVAARTPGAHRIHTLRSRHGLRSDAEIDAWHRKWLLKRGISHARPITDVATGENVVPAVAWVQEGLWIAGCPSCARGATPVEPGVPFMCCACGNLDLGGKWRPVLWPDATARRDGEALLLRRPLAENRNWLTSRESLADLEAENQKEGVR